MCFYHFFNLEKHHYCCLLDLSKHLRFPLLFMPSSSLALHMGSVFLLKLYPLEFPTVTFCWWSTLYCLSENVFICPPSCHNYRLTIIFSHHIKNLIHCILVSCVAVEESGFSLTVFSSKVIHFFLLAAQNFFVFGFVK